MKSKKKKVWIFIFLAFACILLSIISAIMNRVFFVPDISSDINTLNVLTQVISPYTQCTYLRQDLRIPHIFSFYRLHVYQQKIMNENGHNLNVERHQTMDFFL